MAKKSLGKRIAFNAPVILWFTFLSLGVLVGSLLTGGWLGDFLTLRKSSWVDPMQYLRLFTHCVTHKTLSHFTGNLMMILVVGPLVEEKYGTASLTVMILLTALVTGLCHLLLFPMYGVLGASGIVFMLILLASFVNLQEGTLPLTVLLVAVLYLGNEVAVGLAKTDNISQFSHIIGGLCGAGFGFAFSKRK